MVRPLEFATVRAFGMGRGFQGLVGAPHIAPRLRNLLLWNRHNFIFPCRTQRQLSNDTDFDRKRPLDNQKAAFSQAELYFGRFRKFPRTVKGLTFSGGAAGSPEGS